METNTPTTDNGKWMTTLIVLGALGGLAFLLFKNKNIKKKIDGFQQRAATKQMNKLFSILGPTFKKKVFYKGKTSSTATTDYGTEQLADTFTAAGVGYHLYFMPWYTYTSKTKYVAIEKIFQIRADDGKSAGDTVFIGTWNIKGDKLQMSFCKYSDIKNWGKVEDAIKSGQAKTYSGTIKEILTKATGGKTIVLDGLAARYNK